MNEHNEHQDLMRLTAGRMQNIPPGLQHLVPDGYTVEQMAAWLTENQSILAAMAARHIAVERGYLKPPPMDTP